MRIRYLKPGFWQNEHLVALPFEVRLLFQGLWNLADREGRLEDRPMRIKMMVFPADNVDVDESLQKLADSDGKFILRYEVDGKNYIQIKNWNKHQKPHSREAKSEIPSPNAQKGGQKAQKDPKSTTKAVPEHDQGSDEPDLGDDGPPPRPNGEWGMGNGESGMGNGRKDPSKGRDAPPPEDSPPKADRRSPARRLLGRWKSYDHLIQHRSLTSTMRRSTNARLKEGFTEEDIGRAIDRYAELATEGRAPGYGKWGFGDFVSIKSGQWIERLLDPDWEGLPGRREDRPPIEVTEEAEEILAHYEAKEEFASVSDGPKELHQQALEEIQLRLNEGYSKEDLIRFTDIYHSRFRAQRWYEKKLSRQPEHDSDFWCPNKYSPLELYEKRVVSKYFPKWKSDQVITKAGFMQWLVEDRSGNAATVH